jgi:hypothetical protein
VRVRGRFETNLGEALRARVRTKGRSVPGAKCDALANGSRVLRHVIGSRLRAVWVRLATAA